MYALAALDTAISAQACRAEIAHEVAVACAQISSSSVERVSRQDV